ncbi:MAG: RluA family pseudouridine synthase [Pirellulales bacterium]
MFDVLYEDNHLLAVNKPAMLPTMGVAADEPSLLQKAKQYIREKYRKPGEVYLGVVSRLDAPVTGVLLIARTSKAAARLTEMFKRRDVQKLYWALLPGPVEPAAGLLLHFLRKDERHRRVHVTIASAADAQRAELEYRVLKKAKGHTLLEIELLTGRKHQIRVQLADAFAPILGDRKYGSQTPFPLGIALHSRRLVLQHPVRKTPLEIEAPLPPSWSQFV